MISKVIEERQMRLLGHNMRRNDSDPLKQICFDESGYHHLYEKRRIGRPRLNWVRETMKRTYCRLFSDEQYIEDNEDIIFRLLCAADNREM